MKTKNTLFADLLDFDLPEAAHDIVWSASNPTSVTSHDDWIHIQLPFFAHTFDGEVLARDESTAPINHTLWVRAYGKDIVRLTLNVDDDKLPDDGTNVMLDMAESLNPVALNVQRSDSGWKIVDAAGQTRMDITCKLPEIQHWSDLIPGPAASFSATVYPDQQTAVPFESYDMFKPGQRESFPLAYVERGKQPDRVLFSFHANSNEKFAGTGERFAPLNLSGRTLVLENADALGVNNRRCYKNVPFYLSSRPYGLLILTSAHTRLSLADISTRASQALIEDSLLDLFVIGGRDIERILYNYRSLTGFPSDVPLWSYGIWMSRMTYFSADETRQVAERLRKEAFPCDVIHVDTGWFDEDWICDWKFSPNTFPEPEAYLEEMRSNGFRITLWQHPSVSSQTDIYETALANHYIAVNGQGTSNVSNFGKDGHAAPIDFTNPAAVEWYQGLLANLLKMGVAAIKTDFGESIDLNAHYAGMDAAMLHNLYGLLYQKAAFEITEKNNGEGIIWARAGWIGNQRYPVHWGGDAACSWDGLAGSLRGGLHLGLSGYAFWGHDIPGFHGVPNFMNNWPSDELYVRWTQVGVFTSHMRYHGTQPREPYEYPLIADLIRKWWRLRYALTPYLVEAGRKATQTGLPVLRALIFHHQDDPLCWMLDDQFYCGDAFLVAPILNAGGCRDVYLPPGTWRDFWSGDVISGPRWLKKVQSPLERFPVYVKDGSRIPIYPEHVDSTNDMDFAKVEELVFDESYTGYADSLLGHIAGL
jgi:alpha-D-xyloside xylohydrolase